jgi:hypothetical protein
MTTATGHYAWPVPSPADTARAIADIGGDLWRGLPPKIDDALILLAAARAADAAPDPDQPVPFTLTPKARALLDQAPEDQWACQRCTAAYFGTLPGDGLCRTCRAGGRAADARAARRDEWL